MLRCILLKLHNCQLKSHTKSPGAFKMRRGKKHAVYRVYKRLLGINGNRPALGVGQFAPLRLYSFVYTHSVNRCSAWCFRLPDGLWIYFKIIHAEHHKRNKIEKKQKSKNIVHINTKAKRSQTSCLQEVWPFYSLTSVKDGIINIVIPFIRELCQVFCVNRVFDTLFAPWFSQSPTTQPFEAYFLSNFKIFLVIVCHRVV